MMEQKLSKQDIRRLSLDYERDKIYITLPTIQNCQMSHFRVDVTTIFERVAIQNGWTKKSNKKT